MRLCLRVVRTQLASMRSADTKLPLQGPKCVCTVRGLQPGTRWQLRVRAHNAAGPGHFSKALFASTEAAAPDAPGTPSASQRLREALHLAWSPPPYDGGKGVHAYRLEQQAGALQRLEAGRHAHA